MNLIQNRAAELRADFLAIAHEVGCNPEEIDAAMCDDDGCDTFYLEAEAEARRALAASRLNNRRAIRAVTPRKPPTRRAPRRAAKKASASAGGGGDDGDGLGPWSIEAIDHYFALGALPILSPTFRDHGAGAFSRYRGPTILKPVPHLAISVMAKGDFPQRKTTISWCNAASGHHGEGVVKLVADILKISEPEAADRVARFYANAHTACGSGEGIDRTIARFRKDYIDPYLRRAA